MKCPRCGCENIENAIVLKNSTLEKVGYAALAIGITAVGTMVGGPIGAIAGGSVGKLVANAASTQAASFETTGGWKCKNCGHEWHN